MAFAGVFGKILEVQHVNLSHLQQPSIGLRMAKVLRTVKLIRVLSRIQKFRAIISTTGKFLPILPRFFLLFAIILYVYAIVGMAAFGMDQDDWALKTVGTAYANNIYAVKVAGESVEVVREMYVDHVNFNNFPNTLLTLFSLLMVNNWHVIHDAVEQASDYNEWIVSLYFVSFIVVSVIVTLNLLVSFFLVSYFVCVKHKNIFFAP